MVYVCGKEVFQTRQHLHELHSLIVRLNLICHGFLDARLQFDHHFVRFIQKGTETLYLFEGLLVDLLTRQRVKTLLETVQGVRLRCCLRP